jgi:hypothetical protein
MTFLRIAIPFHLFCLSIIFPEKPLTWFAAQFAPDGSDHALGTNPSAAIMRMPSAAVTPIAVLPGGYACGRALWR